MHIAGASSSVEAWEASSRTSAPEMKVAAFAFDTFHLSFGSLDFHFIDERVFELLLVFASGNLGELGIDPS